MADAKSNTSTLVAVAVVGVVAVLAVYLFTRQSALPAQRVPDNAASVGVATANALGGLGTSIVNAFKGASDREQGRAVADAFNQGVTVGEATA